MSISMGVIFRRVKSEEKEDLTDYYLNNLTSRNCVEIVDNCRNGQSFIHISISYTM